MRSLIIALTGTQGFCQGFVTGGLIALLISVVYKMLADRHKEHVDKPIKVHDPWIKRCMGSLEVFKNTSKEFIDLSNDRQERLTAWAADAEKNNALGLQKAIADFIAAEIHYNKKFFAIRDEEQKIVDAYLSHNGNSCNEDRDKQEQSSKGDFLETVKGIIAGTLLQDANSHVKNMRGILQGLISEADRAAGIVSTREVHDAADAYMRALQDEEKHGEAFSHALQNYVLNMRQHELTSGAPAWAIGNSTDGTWGAVSLVGGPEDGHRHMQLDKEDD